MFLQAKRQQEMFIGRLLSLNPSGKLILMSFENNMKEEKCGYFFQAVKQKNYGTTDISKDYEATSKVGVTVESKLQENKFD